MRLVYKITDGAKFKDWNDSNERFTTEFLINIQRDALSQFCWLSCVNKSVAHTVRTDGSGIVNKSSGNDTTTRHLLE